MSCHIVNLSLLLKSLDYLRNLIADDSNTFARVVKLVDHLLIVTEFTLLTIEQLVLRISMSLLSQFFNFLLENISILLVKHYFCLVEQL